MRASVLETHQQIPSIRVAGRGRSGEGRPVPVAPVIVTRDWGGARATVSASVLRYPAVVWDTGGRRKQLPHAMLSAYVWCTELGDVPWHDCSHGPPPHSVRVLIPRSRNDRRVYAELRAGAKVFERRAL